MSLAKRALDYDKGSATRKRIEAYLKSGEKSAIQRENDSPEHTDKDAVLSKEAIPRPDQQ